jgi:uncharacterized protein (DUF362 family)
MMMGPAALVWFLARVVPKPSRAAYPCQQMAAPLAGGFVAWAVVGVSGGVGLLGKAWRFFRRHPYSSSAGLLVLVALAVVLRTALMMGLIGQAHFTPSEPPNQPMGIGKGIHPGRVAWVHAPGATSWDGKTGNWWDETNTDQRVVDQMVSDSLQSLTGEATDRQAWDALFRHFNRTRNLGDSGYQPGERIAIKINANQDRGSQWGTGRGLPSPHVVSAVLAQLVNNAGVPAEDITVYDATRGRGIGAPIVDKIRANPDLRSVKFVVGSDRAGDGRIAASPDPTNVIHFSKAGMAPAYVPLVVSQAKYLINLALFRAHRLFGVTLTAKNHFGSVYFPTSGAFTPRPLHGCGLKGNSAGSYNCLVDLIGHRQLGGKTLLYMLDGLYPAKHNEESVIRFASFGDDWASSLFMSQDPVAIDSVAVDFLRNEPRLEDIVTGHVDNYLHEAALADKPPSGTVYDPDGDGTRLSSLGVHEHWNNPAEKKYSRNLGKSEGIELVAREIPAK